MLGATHHLTQLLCGGLHLTTLVLVIALHVLHLLGEFGDHLVLLGVGVRGLRLHVVEGLLVGLLQEPQLVVEGLLALMVFLFELFGVLFRGVCGSLTLCI